MHPRFAYILIATSIAVLVTERGAFAAEVKCNTGGESTGWAVASGADFDGDGVVDVAVGAPCAYVQAARNAGRAFVYSGADGSRLLSIKGEQEGQKLGGAISFVDDVSGDGLPDLVVGSPGWSVVDPLFGVKDGAGKIEVYSRDGDVAVLAQGVYAQGSLGDAVAGVADVDGDDVPDVLAGARRDRTGPSGSKVGIAYLFSGADGAAIDWSMGQFNFDEWGRVVAPAADLNGDGIDDVIVASNLADAAPPGGGGLKENNGVVRVLSGADMNEVLVDVTGVKADDKLGRSVAMMGDIDSDGVGDILAGAPGDDPNGAAKAGTVSLFSSSSGLATLTVAEPAPQATAAFGTAVAAAGLVDEDGLPDFVAAAPGGNVGAFAGAGRVHMFSSADGSSLWSLYGDTTGMELGRSLASGSDWDGDGVTDVVVGAPGDAPKRRRGAGSVRLVSGADGSEIRRIKGRRGRETRIFVAGWRAGYRPQVRGFRSSGRRAGVRKDVFRRLRAGELSIAVLDDAPDAAPGLMRLVVAAGHGASDSSVRVIRAGRKGSTVSSGTDFIGSFTLAYGGGSSVATGQFDGATGDEIAVVQADSADGNVEAVFYRRLDTDPVGRITWLKYAAFDVFNDDTVIESFVVAAGGATVAVGDVMAGDGSDDLDEIIVAPADGVPVVRVFSSAGELLAEWLAFPPSLYSGASVAVGDLDGDGVDEIVVGPLDGLPRVKVFNGDGSAFLDPATSSPVEFLADELVVANPGFSGGVRVAVADVDLDGKGEIVLGPGPGATAQILAYEMDGSAVDGWTSPMPFGPANHGAVALAATDSFLRQR